VALPAAAEETAAPDFAHHGRDALPVVSGDGKEVRVITGSLYGDRSPVPTFSAMSYADAALAPNARLPLPAEHEERAVYVAGGAVEVAGDRFKAGQLLVFRPGDEITLTAAPARQTARLLLLGGEPMDGPRHIWWNFVSSRRDRIEQAKADWAAGRFAPVPGESGFISLPDR
jgi:redox-sensitive bicupin YhaK (pirin superfamily)